MSSASETGASAAAAVEAVDGCAEERFLQLDERKDGTFGHHFSRSLLTICRRVRTRLCACPKWIPECICLRTVYAGVSLSRRALWESITQNSTVKPLPPLHLTVSFRTAARQPRTESVRDVFDACPLITSGSAVGRPACVCINVGLVTQKRLGLIGERLVRGSEAGSSRRLPVRLPGRKASLDRWPCWKSSSR